MVNPGYNGGLLPVKSRGIIVKAKAGIWLTGMLCFLLTVICQRKYIQWVTRCPLLLRLLVDTGYDCDNALQKFCIAVIASCIWCSSLIYVVWRRGGGATLRILY